MPSLSGLTHLISEASCSINTALLNRSSSEAGSTSGFDFLLADQEHLVAIRQTAQQLIDACLIDLAASMDLAPAVCLPVLCTLTVLLEVADGSLNMDTMYAGS